MGRGFEQTSMFVGPTAMRIASSLLMLALCMAFASGQTSFCFMNLNALNSCAGNLTGAALGAACCPQIQEALGPFDCTGLFALQTSIMGVPQYQSYWDSIIAGLGSEGCICKSLTLNLRTFLIRRGLAFFPSTRWCSVAFF